MSIANTTTETIIKAGIIDAGDQTQARIEHLREIEKLVGNSYPNKYERSRITGAEDTISNLLAYEPIAKIVTELKNATPENEKPDQDLKAQLNEKLKAFGNARISGRLAVPPRVMGKAAFVHLSDGVNRLQIYVRKQDAKVIGNDTGEVIEGADAAWDFFKLLDHGDFIGAEGFLFLTNTGELSVHVETLQFLSKALVPMPDKMHGIADPELRRRYRYADLIASSLQVEHDGLTTREVFERRAKLISGMRRFLDEHGYIEVETPMLTPKATGAAAKPFATHHNALDIPLYARIAPELYLKRLTVGGFEKVYELNRNFRNEGLSQRHNPEFTMLEFYCAYMDVNGMMDFSEAMIKESVQKSTGSLKVKIDRDTIIHRLFGLEPPSPFVEINFEDTFKRFSMKEAICYYWNSIAFSEHSKVFSIGEISTEWLNNIENVKRLFVVTKMFLIEIPFEVKVEFTKPKSELTEEEISSFKNKKEEIQQLSDRIAETSPVVNNEVDLARVIEFLFENIAEKSLINPTFIIDYPKSISPLSKASPENPQIAERFELFINGMECANGFSELNDPQEQYERFVDQMRERETGDEEAMVLDEDYIRALAYGMPPAAGIGIGIDRLVMLLTNKHSIRDVILFPHMRPVSKDEGEAEAVLVSA